MSAKELNLDAIRPLYAPWEEPTAHRQRAKSKNEPAPVVARRRASKFPVVNNLRGQVREWRDSGYPGISGTTRTLLHYWFERSHRIDTPGGDIDFHYYFCQREAVETLVFLKEKNRTDRVSQILATYGGPHLEAAALGVSDAEDAWARACFKMATGAGKTKVMALCIAWSYFHALFESESPMAKHFVVIAPGLTVYERLKEDFGNAKIFEAPPTGDPIIPPEWRGDWNMAVVEQDAAGGAATGGVIYLTNIHRLYDQSKRRRNKDEEYQPFMGPSVSKATALDVGEELRNRIAAHRKIMVLNDEAHHVWDPDSAWNEAIDALNHGCRSRSGAGIVHQLDFSATPRDQDGNSFKHIVTDTPLGEAVDGGIIKFPIIGKASKLAEGPSKNAGWKYDTHLRLGYDRWKDAYKEWDRFGKKALLFVMCESTEAADEITERLNTDDEVFPEFKGRTINLHTNLKGRIKMQGTGENRMPVFVENENAIKDEDLKALRKLSRELDSGDSPYLCIVSVLMLREGWDVKNVTTIVPLRKYSAASGILAEQTLGRGLRRITGPGTPDGVVETVTVIDHPAFAELYEKELEQEGVIPEIIDDDTPTRTTVDIFVDHKKDVEALDIELPQLSAGYSRKPAIDPPTIEDVKQRFTGMSKLPLDAIGNRLIDFEGRSLVTGELLSVTQIEIPELATGVQAIAYFITMIEAACKVQHLHRAIGGLIQTFLEEVLFQEKVSLYDARMTARLAERDVAEHVLAVFVPLVRERTTQVETRRPELPPVSLKDWKPFPASHSERNPCKVAAKTMFNLVPCRGGLEGALVPFLDLGNNGVAAFAKNAGPQSLRIDYVRANGQLSTYTPDFFVRTDDGKYWLVETKGREDADVPRKAKAAIQWCEAASKVGTQWEYVFVAQAASTAMSDGNFAALVRACAPYRHAIIYEQEMIEAAPLFADQIASDKKAELPAFVDKAAFAALPNGTQKMVEEAVALFEFLAKREEANMGAAFQAILGEMDKAAEKVLKEFLQPSVPPLPNDQRPYFDPFIPPSAKSSPEHYTRLSRNLRKMLLYDSGLMPIGLLRDCFDFAMNDKTKIGGVFDSIADAFRITGGRKILDQVAATYDFRNDHVAHQKTPLTDKDIAAKELGRWIKCLSMLYELASGTQTD